MFNVCIKQQSKFLVKENLLHNKSHSVFDLHHFKDKLRNSLYTKAVSGQVPCSREGQLRSDGSFFCIHSFVPTSVSLTSLDELTL